MPEFTRRVFSGILRHEPQPAREAERKQEVPVVA